MCVLDQMHQLLAEVAKNGVEAFYSGHIAKDIVGMVRFTLRKMFRLGDVIYYLPLLLIWVSD